MDYNVYSLTVFSNPPHSQHRISIIPEELLRIDADIISIQEVYTVAHVNFICESVKHVYPYCARIVGSTNFMKLHNGLMILSKYEIVSSELVSHRRAVCIERWFGHKASLRADVMIPNFGKVAIVNTHPTAGGTNPDSLKADTGREIAIQQTLQMAEDAKKNGIIPILIGDFNCAPDSSAANYQYIINNGYRDCFEEAITANILPDKCSTITWDPKNMLNIHGPHAHMPAARLDHIFLPVNEIKLGKVTSCNVVFTEKIVNIPRGRFIRKTKVADENGLKSTLSDHYGIVIEVECT